MLTFVPDISIFTQERMLAFLRCKFSFLYNVKKQAEELMKIPEELFPGVLFWLGSLTFEKYQLVQ